MRTSPLLEPTADSPSVAILGNFMMSPCSNSQSGKPGNVVQESATRTACHLSSIYQSSVEHEEDEDEEEDMDFNPLLKDNSSLEASSSISSEVEGLDADVDSGYDEAQAFAPFSNSDRKGDGLHSSSSLEEITGRIEVCSQGHGDDLNLENVVDLGPKKGKSDLIPQLENSAVMKNDTSSIGGAHPSNDFSEEEMNLMSSRMLCNPRDDDAICKRTRARYSLASFSLDELEAFLQETDDEDDLPDVDDEEEYRKFLAAVFNDGHSDGDLATVDHGNDEDEDNDADFELELEEALESDIINCVSDLNREDSKSTAVRRPKTRRNMRQMSSIDVKEKVPEFVRKPLRPLVPVFPGATVAPLPGYNGRHSLLQTSQNLPSWPNLYSMNAFTPDQMGQLFCLIYEHVQLLIQVYSLSVLDPSRKSIASHVQGLLSEMLKKRDEALTLRKTPHPTFFFRSPHFHPSALNGNFRRWQQSEENATGPSEVHDSPSFDNQQGCTTSCDQPSEASTIQDLPGSCWFPYLDSPIHSILDIAPLKLVGKYVEGVTTAVQDQMRRYVEPTGGLDEEKQPLFPHLCSPSQVVSNAEITKGTGSQDCGGGPSLLSNHGAPKKTLAATIVESTKKQSVALVPKRIAELAMQFYPLFNPALFPHKPPPVSVANRVLFTDSEDELLALGLMEYNTDWKAIQQRFLPCKSKHQIFVRQKNRCSSKAPENPIKAVRRLKTSPLTTEEISRISEGLKMFKMDWMSIWNLIVPYRDPSLLPRQWRIALGTQKSYKLDPSKREKRRLYEWKRRQSKRFASMESGDSGIEKDNEVYAHELFLSDSRPVPANPSSEPSTSNAYSGWLPRGESNMEESESFDKTCEKRDSSVQGSRSWGTGQTSMVNLSSTLPASRSVSYEPIGRPYRSRHPRSSHVVKLAPGLPPVNLPPSVRVISEAAFRNPQHRPPSGTESIDSPRCIGNTSSSTNMNQRKDSSQNHGNSPRSDIVMHPSLSEAPGNRHAPCNLLTDENIGPSSLNLCSAWSEQKNHSSETGSSRKVLSGVDRCEPSGNAITCGGAVNELDLESNTLSISPKAKDSTTCGREVFPSYDEDGGAIAGAGDSPMLHEIIMEQEELSDSDEEVEHVEFECEEMADSDCEDVESKSCPILNI